MKDEIKEILDYLKKEVNKFEESKTYLMETYNYREQDIENIEQHKKYIYFKKLLDYITNLQEENERLKKVLIKPTFTKREIEKYKSRIDKAIEYIKNDWYELNTRDIEHCVNLNKDIRIDLLNILQGEDKDGNN